MELCVGLQTLEKKKKQRFQLGHCEINLQHLIYSAELITQAFFPAWCSQS